MTRHHDERGAFLIVWAMLLLALLTMVAIVVDLGHVRDTRRQAQRTADLAALAAGQDMAGGDVIRACQAAANYVKSNASLATLNETCFSAFSAPCNPANPVELTMPAGRFVVTVRSPILDAEIEDPNYPVNPLTGTRVLDGDGKPCERMRVSVEERNTALFAGVVGVDDFTARASAVIRGFIGTNPTQNAGLVVLERVACEAIVAGGGSGLASVLVKGSIDAAGKPRPGIIQVDTKALAPPCSNAGGNPSDKYAVFGGKLTPSADRPGLPSVEAQGIGGVPGRLDLFALSDDPTNTHTAYDVPGGGVSPGPTPGLIASRNVVDKVYNALGPAGTPGRVTKLVTDTDSLLSSLAAAVTTCLGLCNAVQGDDGLIYAVYPPGTPGGVDPNGNPPLAAVSGTPACSTNDATPIDVPALARVYVNCPDLDVPKIIFRGAKVVLAGELTIGSNRLAAFPNATEVIVKGCGSCSGGSAAAIDASGALLVNSGSAPLAAECNDNSDNDGDGKIDFDGNGVVANIDGGCVSVDDWTERSCVADRAAPVPASRLVVATGPITTSSASVVQMCQTFVLMADGATVPSQTTGGDTTCSGATDINGIVTPQPCPVANTFKGHLKIFGTIDWVGPNQTPDERNTSQLGQEFEDLAVWTETSQSSQIQGAGNTVTGGVFFFPNALFRFTGQASQLIDLNAQFVSRRLEVSGQGTLSMQPNPNDTVDTPAPYFALIR